ncbi:enkurin domain-containing protein 1 [Adelges cooleyi]|uniref:enkurin domain-containing protein 1 n=1 Tax=Adelges cooleyi TaxID=133065 RepID=UPI00217F557D|nr:enkurin domain-containing protein 1 [Adelges cooleyi]
MCSIRDFFPIEYRVGGTKPSKNFIQENRRYVKNLEKTTQAYKSNENQSHKSSYSQVKKIQSRNGQNKEEIKTKDKSGKNLDLDKIEASIQAIRSAIAQTKITQRKLSTSTHTTNNKTLHAFKDQAVQTIFPFNEESVLKDSIIRYPSYHSERFVTTAKSKHMNTIAIQTEGVSATETSNSKTSSEPVVSIKQKHIVTEKKTEPAKNCIANTECHHQIGEIPKYLKNRKALKEKNARETQKKIAIRHELGLDDPACPPGHMLLPKTERLEHLNDIQKKYDYLIKQLIMMPVSSDSLKIKEKRKHLERELDKLQIGIKLFSREKLYVKVNPKVLDSYK